jgi:pyrroline-5-carboxylate reductase
MTTRTVGFIGAGRVTRILLQGLEHGQALPPDIVVSDPNPDSLARLKQRFPQVAMAQGDNPLAAARQVVVLAVHPPVMGEVLSRIRPVLQPDALVISLAPKLTIARLAEMLGGFQRIVRVIPNAPSVIGAGYNPMAFSPTLTTPDRKVVTAMFDPLGEHPEVDEAKLEGYALLTGMGPTYFWFQMQALRELAPEFGLAEAEVIPALKRTLCGATRTLLESGMNPVEVMDLIPVKPLGDVENSILEMYRTRLPALYQKIKP